MPNLLAGGSSLPKEECVAAFASADGVVFLTGMDALCFAFDAFNAHPGHQTRSKPLDVHEVV